MAYIIDDNQPVVLDNTTKSHTKLNIPHYRQTSNTSRNLVDTKSVDHLDVVGALCFGAAPITSSLST